MSRGAFEIWWPIGWDLEDVLDCLERWLLEHGYEVKREKVNWRVMMYRKTHPDWTQLYTGLTTRAKAQRSRLSVAGPEREAMFPLQWAFYKDGIFDRATELAEREEAGDG